MAKKGQLMWFRQSASEAHKVKFVRWVRMRMGTGGKDTNKLGVGAIVWSDWLFRHPLMNRRGRQGLKEGYCALRPYMELYRNNPYGNSCPVKVRRSKLEKVKKGIRR